MCLLRSNPLRCWHGLLVLAAALGLGLDRVKAQEVRSYVSSKAGDRLSAKPAQRFRAGEGSPATFRIDEARAFQTMAGFGGSFLEAGMICLNSLAPDQQERVLRAIFDPVQGAGFSAMKAPLAGTDFMSAGPWYTYNDTPGDVAMTHFSIARDLGTNGLVTYIQRARRHGSFVLQAPMDYPPDWMLFDVHKNQDVDPKYFDALARYYLRYLQEYQKQGVFVDYLSLFNEPGIYTKIPWHKILVLFRDHVAPLLRREGIKTQLMPSESSDRTGAGRDYPTVLEDPEARRFVAVLPYHGYELKDFGAIRGLRERYPHVPLWMTELCHAYQAGTPASMKLPRYDFEDGDFWGRQILADVEAGASAWIYWNLILDQNGGPWAVSPVHGNPDPNIQHAVVIINRETHEVTYTGCYYYLAHFSKFVRPGAVRVGVEGAAKDVRCLAFRAPEGGWVAELMNSARTPTEVSIGWRGQTLPVSLPALSMTTLLWSPAR